MAKYHGKTSLAELYAKQYGTTQKVAEERLKEMVNIIELGLTDNNYDGIQFIDSITLKKVVRKAKLGRNPRTNVEVIIPEHIGVKAIVGGKLASKLGEGK